MVEKKKPAKEVEKAKLKLVKICGFSVPNKKTPYPQVPYLE